MADRVLGLHHITAIAGNAQRNLNFYTRVLGLRLVKKTVNFDDPGTYHFYFGNENGAPGTILTFFPWEGMRQGYTGIGMAAEIGYSVPVDSLDFWAERFKKFDIRHDAPAEKFGEKYLSFRDPDGLKINLIETLSIDKRIPWETKEIDSSVATKGFHNVTLLLKSAGPTGSILSEIFGYKLSKQEGIHYRFETDAVDNASVVDIIEAPGAERGIVAAGTNHHVAFRVKDDNILMQYREIIESKGFNITPKIDRDYFYSLYFREPGGVLFELATDNPGFTKDEPLSELGSHLKLPRQYENSRVQIEKVLPILQ